MRKRVIVIFVSIITLLLFLIIIIGNDKENKKDYTYKVIDKIVDKFNNKEDLLIYITSSSDECGGTCIDSKDIISYYSEVYKLEFIEFDKNKESNKDYNSLIDKLNIKDAIINIPAVIMIKQGVVKAIASIDTEEYLRKYLLENEFISENESDKDYQISYSQFEELYVSNNNNLILIYSYGTTNYKVREKLFNLSSKYGFKYNTIYTGTVDNVDMVDFLDKELNGNYSIPMLLIVKDSKVIDYTTSNNNKEIKEFLEKNNIIN